jgi:hypothetical protein
MNWCRWFGHKWTYINFSTTWDNRHIMAFKCWRCYITVTVQAEEKDLPPFGTVLEYTEPSRWISRNKTFMVK